MKIKDAVVWPSHWSTPLGTQSENAPVEDGFLADIRVWVGTFNITLVIQCADGKYYGALRTPNREAYPWVLDFLRRNKGRRLRDILEKEIDFHETAH
jgi:hypothetical protein